MKCNRSVKPSRCGSILVAVLTCMVVSISLVTVAIQCTLAARRSGKKNLQMQQAVQLLHAGIKQARVRLQSANTATDFHLAAWDAKGALPDYYQAEVSYQVIRSSADQQSIELRCIAKLAVSAAVQDLIQLSHNIPIPSYQSEQTESTERLSNGDDKNELSKN
jgi:type II secretory pathway component PulK